MNKIFTLLLTCFIFSNYVTAQLMTYKFQQSITGIENEWHQIKLPPTIYQHLKPNFADIRIYGLTENDTIEVPYLIKEVKEQSNFKNINFKVINSTKNKRGYYYTFELNQLQSINQIQLSFANDNFDFNSSLSGSNDQREWFTILENQKLIGIKNEYVNFNYTILNFKQAKYKYFRLNIQSPTPPILQNSSITISEKPMEVLDTYKVNTTRQTSNTKSKSSTILLTIKDKVPTSSILLQISDKIDFYRNYQLSYLTDSVVTPKETIYNYQLIKQGVIHSFAKEAIRFSPVIAQQFKIEIFNQDNQALTIESAQVQGPPTYLVARFNQIANYKLVYGNKAAQSPAYDIAYYTEKIPEMTTSLILGEVVNIQHKEKPKVTPLFESNNWLYFILSIIIAGLAWFSIKMLRNSK
ncbi:hypothetical protein DNU06_01175 [Putridiphycobacter roseus]|uniref:DUF3999 domain-containing protein n=1 Tax=Putridiphycobacter roseus TaxID=2219161 RepID=A0A2W1NG57_9FLAO|nr:DUF3999 family protein [Putridiphycobacter roseus]PZE18475.1 hypothetical protein DNU06_01175 [Putridiphycobacter roseus]